MWRFDRRSGAPLALAIALACSPVIENAESTDVAQHVAQPEIAVIQIDGYGEIRLRFFPDKAPNHVANFKKLARAGFYDGTTFHRVIPRFMIQGGDPASRDTDPENDGTGGPTYTIAAEFNDIRHRRGIVSMARRSDPDSAGSQFFIMVADSPNWRRLLDRQYTVFGEVISGIEVVDRVAAVERDRKDRPLRNVVLGSVRIEPARAGSG